MPRDALRAWLKSLDNLMLQIERIGKQAEGCRYHKRGKDQRDQTQVAGKIMDRISEVDEAAL